ncbi:SDR family NAD(P)-dependent oxidoreductase [Roseomonas haemaphysalidis]|nr:SDR family NAD(P)-dependent oxidoreductase [Roseomonas haemaphysalidis]
MMRSPMPPPSTLALLPLAPLLPLALLAGAGLALLAGRPARAVRREDVAGRVFVVTGASSGVGRAVAVRLGALGGRVVLAARREAELEAVAAELRAAGGEALVVPTDVSDAAAVAALAAAAVERFGGVDAWINNAGIGALGRFEDISVEDHARTVDVNLKGVIFGSHAALRLFRARGQGTLVNVGSVESRIPMPYHTTYAATKHAILGLGRALRQEARLAGLRGVGVVTVMPWALDTPWWNVAGNHTGRSPRMILMDGPEQTAGAIVQAAVHPMGDVAVGWKAKATVLGHQIVPGVAEHLAADVMHKVQQEMAPPAGDREGALHEPPAQDTGEQGGVRAKMRREDATGEAEA